VHHLHVSPGTAWSTITVTRRDCENCTLTTSLHERSPERCSFPLRPGATLPRHTSSTIPCNNVLAQIPGPPRPAPSFYLPPRPQTVPLNSRAFRHLAQQEKEKSVPTAPQQATPAAPKATYLYRMRSSADEIGLSCAGSRCTYGRRMIGQQGDASSWVLVSLSVERSVVYSRRARVSSC
jgi:hypothetical protein